jgi:hypothetical protein
LLTTIAASDVAVESATITAGSTAAVLAANELTLAPATAAAATTAFNALATALATEIVPAAAGQIGDGLEASNGIGSYATTTFGTLATMLANDTAITPAQITALATADAALASAFAFEKASDAATLTAAQVLANGAALDATSRPAANALAAIGTFTGANLAATALVADTVAATAAENLAGEVAFAAVVHAAVLANNAAYATAFAALTAPDKVAVTDLVVATIQAQAARLTQDGFSGDIVGFTAPADPEVVFNAVTAAIAGAGGSAAVQALVATDANDIVDFDPQELDGIVAAAEDQAFDAAVIAAYEGLLASVDLIADADSASQVAAIQAANVATVTLGADNIDVNGGAATVGNDVFIFNEANGNMVVGTAATAAAPENVLFGAGDDSVIILGEYTFVTVESAAAFAALGTTAVGDAAVTEIFVYQNATTGDTVLSIEDNAFDGSTTTGTALTTLTLTDITWTGVDVNVVDGNTILSEVAAIV